MAGLIRPLLVRLFPDIPPIITMGAMVMNIAANWDSEMLPHDWSEGDER